MIMSSLKKADVCSCMFSQWYPAFHNLTIKSKIIDLPEDFVKYLLDDGPLVLPTSVVDNIHVRSPTSFLDEEQENKNDDEQLEVPEFRDVIEAINEVLTEYSAVFPKLNWSSPRDATWISPCNSLKCTSPGEILLLLKSSQFITYDLTSPFKVCDDSSEADPLYTRQLVLRKWAKLSPGMEFRCFVKNKVLIAICQRQFLQHHEHVTREKDLIAAEIELFLYDKIINKFELNNYTVDVYKKLSGNYWVIDFNPWGEMTDPLMFTWEELNNDMGPNESKDGQAIVNNDCRVGEFRFVTSASTMQPSDMLSYRMPQDFLDLSTGEDATKLIDFMRMKIQQAGDDSSSSDEDEAWQLPTQENS